jgi:hypothetical protein
VDFEIVGGVRSIEVIAAGRKIREILRLHRLYGRGRWRKLKGETTVLLQSGRKFSAEVHWYEAHGIGKKEFKIKRILGAAREE